MGIAATITSQAGLKQDSPLRLHPQRTVIILLRGDLNRTVSKRYFSSSYRDLTIKRLYSSD